jgi:hypothetical protein
VDAEAAERERAIARVMAAGAAGRKAPSRALITAAAVVSIVCAGALGYGYWFAPASRESGDSPGSAARRSLKLPTASVVAEPGATLRWTGAHVTQDAGEVFYRLRGGVATTVATPRAVIEAGHEACVRVTVRPAAVEILVEQGTVTIGGVALEAGARVVR